MSPMQENGKYPRPQTRKYEHRCPLCIWLLRINTSNNESHTDYNINAPGFLFNQRNKLIHVPKPEKTKKKILRNKDKKSWQKTKNKKWSQKVNPQTKVRKTNSSKKFANILIKIFSRITPIPPDEVLHPEQFVWIKKMIENTDQNSNVFLFD